MLVFFCLIFNEESGRIKIELNTMIKKDSKKLLNDQVKIGILRDEKLNDFLLPFFEDKKSVYLFIKKCLKKLKTRRMLLHLHWYCQLADDFEKIRPGRPALKFIFLFSVAEGVINFRLKNKKVNSWKKIQKFFKLISEKDKLKITRGMQRALITTKINKLRFSSILKIIYQVRNDAVHGIDFWSFSLLTEEEKQKNPDYYSLITHGKIGKPNRKRKTVLDTNLTYQDFRNVIIKISLEHIKKEF